MRPIPATPLHLGHAREAADLRALRQQGIEAIIDLALNEPPLVISRETIYCRFPIEDGGGADRRIIRAAIDTAASFIRSNTQTLVFCSAGLSRSPAIAAASISQARGLPPADALKLVAASGPADIAPALWGQVLDVLTLRTDTSFQTPWNPPPALWTDRPHSREPEPDDIRCTNASKIPHPQ